MKIFLSLNFEAITAKSLAGVSLPHYTEKDMQTTWNFKMIILWDDVHTQVRDIVVWSNRGEPYLLDKLSLNNVTFMGAWRGCLPFVAKSCLETLTSEMNMARRIYRQTHPEVTILDPPNAIQHLRNNQFMLQVVVDLKVFDSYGSCCIGFEDLLCGVQVEG
ncbi:Inositol-tetrakisphosphate 1-kinase 2 [Morella rubra]|uniref:Inositol-tetrakisphosphate 1-kinase 2 n=1 Tax=Morella rubra TaxID=262757 RepID=A0A6A1VCU5_9ROSI|nr:Inositol-tetrakisphosphate 1-kinase 2 [Morella rubra]